MAEPGEHLQPDFSQQQFAPFLFWKAPGIAMVAAALVDGLGSVGQALV